ncbi:hypothetical protein [Desulfosarcina variabilis]|uniref:hypothetical protein n=1 Tax=Desulfosarcina variabilis TaxID=2300 RepID=UPI003AFA482C
MTDVNDAPLMVLDADGFLRQVLFHKETNPYTDCHRPLIVHDPLTPMGQVISQLKVEPQAPGDDVIDHDIILIWGEERRVITGADILGHLMRGIINSPEPLIPKKTEKRAFG